MWLVPSRRRISKLREFLNSAIKADTSTPGLILVDKQDFKDNEKDYKLLQEYHMPRGWGYEITSAEGMGPKVREVWPLVDTPECKWVGVLNDDHYIVTPEWDKKLISQLNGRNFITCNDRWNAPQRAAGATVFSMPLMRAFGFPMFPAQIDHLGIDDVFETIGRSTGCWEVDMKVIVEHRHAFKNPDMMDDTHRKVYGTKPWHDPVTGQLNDEAQKVAMKFKEWFEQDAPSVVERVRQLRAQESLEELPNGKVVPVPENRGMVSSV